MAVPVSSQGTAPTAAEKHEAEKAWEALIRTKGGREKLNSITNMVTEYSAMTNLYVFPDSNWYFTVVADGGMPLLYVADGSKSIQYLCNKSGIYEIGHKDESDARGVEELALLLETKWYKPELLRVTREKEGRKQLDVIETMVAKMRIDFAYEPEELLVSEVRFYYKGSIWRKYKFSDYMEIKGIKMPQKMALGFDDNGNFKGLKNPFDIKILLNVDYDPEIFTKPQRATTADAWKRKPKQD